MQSNSFFIVSGLFLFPFFCLVTGLPNPYMSGRGKGYQIPAKRERAEDDPAFNIIEEKELHFPEDCELDAEEDWEALYELISKQLASEVLQKQYHQLVTLLEGCEHFGSPLAQEGADKLIRLTLVDTDPTQTYNFWLADRLRYDYSYGLLFKEDGEEPLVRVRLSCSYLRLSLG